MSIIIYLFEFQLPMCYLNPEFFKFLKRHCGTIPVAVITSGKIEIFSKHQRFLIATDSSKYLLIFVLYVCVILCEFGTLFQKKLYYLNYMVHHEPGVARYVPGIIAPHIRADYPYRSDT
jgi:hypothetical protein